MKDATLKKGAKFLNRILQKKISAERMQELSPYLDILFDANVSAMNRDDFRKACGLKPAREKKKTSNLLTIDYSIKLSLISLVVESHPTRTDVIIVDPKKIERVSMLRPGEGSITGHEYFRRLKESGRQLYDVRVMEEFLKSPEKIPEEWKTGRTYFWGTIFRNGGRLYAACLYWGGGGWGWRYSRLGNVWVSVGFGAVGASI